MRPEEHFHVYWHQAQEAVKKLRYDYVHGVDNAARTAEKLAAKTSVINQVWPSKLG